MGNFWYQCSASDRFRRPLFGFILRAACANSFLPFSWTTKWPPFPQRLLVAHAPLKGSGVKRVTSIDENIDKSNNDHVSAFTNQLKVFPENFQNGG